VAQNGLLWWSLNTPKSKTFTGALHPLPGVLIPASSSTSSCIALISVRNHFSDRSSACPKMSAFQSLRKKSLSATFCVVTFFFSRASEIFLRASDFQLFENLLARTGQCKKKVM